MENRNSFRFFILVELNGILNNISIAYLVSTWCLAATITIISTITITTPIMGTPIPMHYYTYYLL